MTDHDQADDGTDEDADEGAGAGAVAPGHGLSALSSQLGAGLAALSGRSSLPPPAVSPPPPPPLPPPSPASPTVVHRAVAASPPRRVPDAAALAVADRILAAAGHQVPDVDRAVALAAAAPVPSTSSLPAPAFVISTPDGRSWPLGVGQSLTIGRDAARSDIAIDNSEISRRHVVVSAATAGVTATDLGSTNGTSVVSGGVWHDLVPHEPYAMIPGDRLAVPDDIWLVVVDEGRVIP